MSDADCVADVTGLDVSGKPFRAVLRPAPTITLHTDIFPRTDANSPVMCDATESLVFFSHYQPKGHGYRRTGAAGLSQLGDPVPLQLIEDPDPASGKWIESIWRFPGGDWFGWYHAEEAIPGLPTSFCPHIGAVRSHDRGASWHFVGTPFRAPPVLNDTTYQNGFLVGGYGDFCVVPDQTGQMLYLAYSSYVSDEAAQGIAMARFPAACVGDFPAGLELWAQGEWREAAGHLATPLWPTQRGWRNADPDAFWGPAIHFNEQLGAHVMLLNHTANGNRNIVQEGVYISISRNIDDPATWSVPVKLVQGGGWYPQAIGLEAGCGDTRSISAARFFMGGYSAWTLELADGTSNRPDQTLRADRDLFVQLFGTKHKPAW